MVLINMRIFKIILVIFTLLLSIINCLPTSLLRLEHRGGNDEDAIELPLDNPSTNELSLSSSLEMKNDDFFDQRQNGTENYRIHVDGLVVVVAPIEALLFAASNTDNNSTGITNNFTDSYFPVNQNNKDEEIVKPEISKPLVDNDNKITEKPGVNKKIIQKPHLRLASLLGPVLKKLMTP